MTKKPKHCACLVDKNSHTHIYKHDKITLDLSFVTSL